MDEVKRHQTLLFRGAFWLLLSSQRHTGSQIYKSADPLDSMPISHKAWLVYE